MSKKKGNVNKDRLIRQLAKQFGDHNIKMRNIVEGLFNNIINELQDGKRVSIVGFGSFEVRKRIERNGINPQTGAQLRIKATKTPAFTPGKTLKKAVKSSLKK